jgi:RHS repeat-associated protein
MTHTSPRPSLAPHRTRRLQAAVWQAVVLTAFVVLLANGCSGSGGDVGRGYGGEAPDTHPAIDAVVAHEAFARKLDRAVTPEVVGDHLVVFSRERHARELTVAVPVRADGRTFIEMESGSADRWVEVEPVGRREVDAELHRGIAVYPDAERGADVVTVLRHGRVEEFRVLHDDGASSIARYRVRHGSGIETLRIQEGFVVAEDLDGRIVTRTTPASAIDALGTLLDVDVELAPRGDDYLLTVSVRTESATYPIVVDPEWVSGPGWPERAVFALNSIYVDEGSTISGDVSVEDEAALQMLGAEELHLENDATISDGDVEAHGVVFIGTAGVSHGDIFADHVINGPSPDPIAVPLEIEVPAVPYFQPGTTPKTVTTAETLAESEHGAVVVQAGSLTLSGGLYEFESLEVQAGGAVYCNTQCELRIADFLDAQGKITGTDAFEIFVLGENANLADPDVQPAAAELNDNFTGRIFVPNGTLRVESPSVDGVLVARDVRIGQGVYVEGSTANLEPDCSSYCDAVVDPECGNSPAHADCVDSCEAELTGGYCQYFLELFVNCVNGGGSRFLCDGNDDPYVPPGPREACTGPQADLNSCQSFCATAVDTDPCSLDICDYTPTSSMVDNPPAPIGTSCADPDPCNGTETCDGANTGQQACLAGAPLTVPLNTACTSYSTCNGGVFTATHSGFGTGCDDGDACTVTDICDGAGTCQPGTPKVVTDNESYTLDLCDPATGIVTHSDTSVPDAEQAMATDIFESMAFLYTGPEAAQTGMTPGPDYIEKERAAVVRGHVRDAGGNLAGVSVSVLNDADAPADALAGDTGGATVTDAAGEFSLAVNGGGRLTLVFERSGYVTAHRAVYVRPRDFAFTEDLFLKPYDPNVTTIEFGAGVMQVARGSVESDSLGTRQATLLVPAGTTHNIGVGEFSTALPNMNVRLTEFTVEVNDPSDGPDAMPAALPGSSAYTYALELSAESSTTAGAPYKAIGFHKKVILYVENFLEFDVGRNKPLGYYDRDKGHWVPEHDGLVLEIVGEQNGLARLDLDGDGNEDDTAYTTVGIGDPERAQLAQLYDPGQELWRVAMDHFTPGDINDGMARGEEAVPDFNLEIAPPADKPDCSSGSIIECQNQILGQRIPVKGTPFALHYQSDRTPGYKAAYRVDIPYTPPVGDPALPAGIQSAHVEVLIAGRRERTDFGCPQSCGNGLTHEFVWSGKDAWDRTVLGPQMATVRVGYGFRRSWVNAALALAGGTGLPWLNNDPNGGPVTFGAWPANALFQTVASGDNFREYIVWTEERVPLGSWSNKPMGLGGWSLDAHHAYSPMRRVLYRGDGNRVSDTGRSATIEKRNISADMGHISAGIAFLPTGDLIVAVDGGNPEGILSIAPDNTATALTQMSCSTPGAGNDGLASLAQVCRPRDVAVGPDGSIYIVEETSNFAMIRRIDPDGDIHQFAGSGAEGNGTDGGAATASMLADGIRRVAAGPDGNVYIVDEHSNDGIVVRRVDTAGRITRVAGGGTTALLNIPPATANPFLATDVDLGNSLNTTDVAVGPDGSLYLTPNNMVVRVFPDGYVERVAGTVTGSGMSGDGGPATSALLDNPRSIVVMPDGGFYIAVNQVDPALGDKAGGVRYVAPNGTITTVAGGPNIVGCTSGVCGVPGAAKSVDFDNGGGALTIAVSPSDELHIHHSTTEVDIYRVRKPLPGGSTTDILVASEDGSEIYVFNQRGRHDFTRDALTGKDLFKFAYTDGNGTAPAGLLHTITDIDDRVTTIHHDANGVPLKIAGPFLHETTFPVIDATTGYLKEIQPAGLTTKYSFTYDATGLMTQFTDPSGKQKDYTFTTGGELHGFSGLLTSAAIAGLAGQRDLIRTNNANGFSVSLENASNNGAKQHVVARNPDGTETWSVTPPGGPTTTTQRLAGATQTTMGDGTVVTVTQGADPRWLLQAPVAKEVTIDTGSALNPLTIYTERDVALTTPGNDPLSVDTWTETTCIQGPVNPTTMDCDAAAIAGMKTVFSTAAPTTITRTSTGNRSSTTTLDADGRPTIVDVGGAAVANVHFSYNGSSTDAKGQLESVTYVHPNNALENRSYTFGYDDRGNLITLTDPLDRTVHLTPDDATRVVGQTLPRKANEADQVWQFDGGTTYVDETVDFNSTTPADVLPFATGSPTNAFFIGFATPFEALEFTIDTAGTTGAVSWTYWSTTGWKSANATDGTQSFTNAGTHLVTFDAQSDWEATAIGDLAQRYYLRAEVVTTYTSDPGLGYGRVLQLPHDNGTTTGPMAIGFGYDDADRLMSLDPAGSGSNNVHGFTFNGASLAETYTAPGATTFDDYSYNGDRQLTDLLFDDTNGDMAQAQVDPVYDTDGRLDYVDQNIGTSTYKVDVDYEPPLLPPANTDPNPQHGKVKTITATPPTAADAVQLDIGYNGALLTSVQWSGSGMGGSSNTVTWLHDDALRVTSETVKTESAIAFAYADGDGLLTGAGALNLTRHADHGAVTGTTLAAGSAVATTTTDITPFGELDTYEVDHDPDGSGAMPKVQQYQVDYERDVAGRVIRKAETVAGTTTYYAYEYDIAGRLDKVHEDTANPCNPLSNCAVVEDYDYDANGNRDATINGVLMDCSYDSQDRLQSCTTASVVTNYTTEDWGAISSKVIDPTGTAVTHTYTYDLSGNLHAADVPAGLITYIVDGAGRRVGRKLGSTHQQWLYRDALNPVAELDGSGAVVSVFVYGEKGHVPDYMIKGGSTYRFVTDQLGSVRLVVNVANGNIEQEWSYDAWGNATLESAPTTVDFQPFGYAGGLYDHDTGLVRFGARDYDPEIGRWLSKDPIGFNGGQPNLYAHVSGDPVNYVDLTGASQVWVVKLVHRFVNGLRPHVVKLEKIGIDEAIERATEGAAEILAKHQQGVAREIAEGGCDAGMKPLKHGPHKPGERPHFHPVDAAGRSKGGHIMWGFGFLLDFNGDGGLDVLDVFEATNPTPVPVFQWRQPPES